MDNRLAYDLAEKTILDARDRGSEVYDEVALCFRHEHDLMKFVEHAVLRGMDNFNSVRDTMVRQDARGQFDVHFEFLKFPNEEWRIEAMCITDGEAPLHASALAQNGDVCVIHLAYKCATLEDYQEETRRLMSGVATRRAEYRNGYGLFSYWSPTGQPSVLPYVKPRVNLRDQGIVQ